MKLEKISDNQIRCTLNKDDLVDRELRISELAYGTEKAKDLFRDMMQQASSQFGFEADDIPLMIEAIPVSSECLILVITKVEDPDELDTRFSKFSTDKENADTESDSEDEESFADEILNCFGQLDDLFKKNEDSEEKEDIEFIPLPKALSKNKENLSISPKEENPIQNTNLTKVYIFSNLDDVTKLSCAISVLYNGKNTLYKNPMNSYYYLVISKNSHSPEEFNKVCNIISEYGKLVKTTYASTSYYEEHFEIIIKDKCIQVLSKL